MTLELEAVIDKILELLQAEPSLNYVCHWHKINGLVPSDKPTVSIGCDDETYEEYTQALDQCKATFRIYASLDNRKLAMSNRRTAEQRLEYGDRCLRQMAHSIRSCLVKNYSLAGAADSSFPSKIEYVTADEHVDLHIAVISLHVEVFVSRKDAGEAPTIETIDMKMELEGGL